MAYRIERSDADYEFLMQKTLMDWNYQDHDIYFLSSEGHKIFTNKALLAFYSSSLKEILNDPVVAFRNRVPSISVPATFASVTTLLKILVEGKALAINKESMKKVTELAIVLGIKLQNIIIDKDVAQSDKDCQDRVKIELKQFTIKKETSIDQIREENVEKFYQKNNDEWECSSCKRVYKGKKSVIRHIKRFCFSKTQNPLERISEQLTCKVCRKRFNKRSLLRYHKRTHKEKTLQCGTCPKLFRIKAELRRHEITHVPESEKPFQCDRCPKKFCEKIQKKKHMEKCLTITSVKQENLESHKSKRNMEEVKVTDFLSVEVEENVTKVTDTDVDSGEDDGNSTDTDFENEADEEDIPKAGDTDNESVDENVSDVNETSVESVEVEENVTTFIDTEVGSK